MKFFSGFQWMYSSVHIHIHYFICIMYLFHLIEYWSTFLFLNVRSVNSVIFTKRMKTSLTSIFLDLEILPSFSAFPHFFLFFLTFILSSYYHSGNSSSLPYFISVGISVILDTLVGTTLKQKLRSFQALL